MSKLGTPGNFPGKAEEILARILHGCRICRFFVRRDNAKYIAKCLELEHEMGKTAGLQEAHRMLDGMKIQ